MSVSKSICSFFVVVVVAASAGWSIPDLYESTNLDQSSDVGTQVFRRAMLAGVFAGLALLIAWLVWHRSIRRHQFGLRTMFAVTAAVAMASCVWMMYRVQTEIRFVHFYVITVLVGMLVGRNTFLASARPVEGAVEQTSAVTKTGWCVLGVGLLLVCVQLAVDWWWEFRQGLSGFVWVVVMVGVLRYSSRTVRLGTACFLAAILLPFVWLFGAHQRFEDTLSVLWFFTAAPGIIPAALIKWTPDSLVFPTMFFVLETLLGFLFACRSRLGIAVLAGLAASAGMFASFGLHALFRA